MTYNCIYTPPIDTGLGYVLITADEIGVTGVDFIDKPQQEEKHNAFTRQCQQELDEYFNADRKTFDVPLHMIGTPFQLKVWQTLQTIPYGTLWSYKDLACAVGSSNYARAVGHANGKNPISIIVPCHRVIGANKKLTGYSGGLHRKQALLNIESELFI